MTGTVIVRQALSLLGYTDTNADGGVPGGVGVYRRALPVLNQIAAELWYMTHDEAFVPLTSLQEEIPLSPRVVLNVLPYGLAMLLAQTAGDADNQTVFAAQYEARRSTASDQPSKIRDALPRCEG